MVVASLISAGIYIAINEIQVRVTQHLVAGPILTLRAKSSHPQNQYNFTYGYDNPNLWNLKSGQGNVTMGIFANGSTHTIANLSNVKTDVYTIIGYPSEHFTFATGMPLQSVEASNLSSYVSFDVVNHTKEMPTDVAYDIFIGS